ncbi:MAG TPA: hypothetical protein VGG33_20540 [Polyangia bacterium]
MNFAAPLLLSESRELLFAWLAHAGAGAAVVGIAFRTFAERKRFAAELHPSAGATSDGTWDGSRPKAISKRET